MAAQHSLLVAALALTLLPNSAVAQGEIDTTRYGRWDLKRWEDDMGDLYVLASSDGTALLEPGARPPVLEMSCDPDPNDRRELVFSITYSFDRYLGGDPHEMVDVRYRIDDDPASERLEWGLLGDHRAATWYPFWEGQPHASQARELLAQLATGGSVIFEVVDRLDGETLRARFSLDGFDEVLDALAPRGECRPL